MSSVLGGGLLALPAGSAAAATILIIYVYADDCAPCQLFAAQDWPQFLASPLSRAVKFVKTHAPKTTQAYQMKYWPAEARPYHGMVKVPIVPAFILVSNGTVVMVGNGIVGWRNQVLPKINLLASAG